MAKTKTTNQERKAKQTAKKMANGQAPLKETPEQLYETALNLVEQAQPEEALKTAKKLWAQVQNGGTSQALPALNLLGEISVELGDVDSARGYFEQAAALDPTGTIPEAMGGGAEKFLWLAQLSEEGGKESVQWYEKGVSALQAEIAALDDSKNVVGLDEETLLLMRVEKKRRLANALCSIVEVYMTDLSWEDDAEARCENLITEAVSVEDETSAEVLQTLASVRLSQDRTGDAQAALRRSIQSWSELDPEDPAVPDFATRISLSRLLMEAKMEDDAVRVLNRLVLEDDQSVEAWYLGGWCQHLIAEREQGLKGTTNGDSAADKDIQVAMKGSQHWLNRSIKLYQLLDYEDTRLLEHAKELVEGIDTVLGPEDEQAEGGDEDYDDWDGIDEDEDVDEEMNDA
ncbi:hypothetical protein LTR09_007277 [Extremus antarcticus]|uniref:Assembly chaperone of rpl4 n=1 Tax=Extremus antarcticus TaxID=702011 RepID=A0AAJ0GB99_9PEZI|nr:hypothetical protein LTR09_007277 [Extremus antarcticus]